MKRILCPVDFSEASVNGLKYAFEFAKKFGGELLLFHAEHPPHSIAETQTGSIDLNSVQIESKNRLEKLCRDLAKENDFHGVSYLFNVKTGFAEDKILELSHEQDIDMIITGTEGAHGFDKIFGTVSSDLAIKATCPVLVIPENYKYKEIKEIVFTTDLSGNGNELALYIFNLARTYKAHISFLNIQKKQNREAENLLRQSTELLHLTEYENLDFHVLENNDVSEGIIHFAKENNADLIVMSTQHKNFVEKIFSKSVTKEVVYDSDIPTMALHKIKVREIHQ